MNHTPPGSILGLVTCMWYTRLHRAVIASICLGTLRKKALILYFERPLAFSHHHRERDEEGVKSTLSSRGGHSVLDFGS